MSLPELSLAVDVPTVKCKFPLFFDKSLSLFDFSLSKQAQYVKKVKKFSKKKKKSTSKYNQVSLLVARRHDVCNRLLHFINMFFHIDHLDVSSEGYAIGADFKSQVDANERFKEIEHVAFCVSVKEAYVRDLYQIYFEHVKSSLEDVSGFVDEQGIFDVELCDAFKNFHAVVASDNKPCEAIDHMANKMLSHLNSSLFYSWVTISSQYKKWMHLAMMMESIYDYFIGCHKKRCGNCSLIGIWEKKKADWFIRLQSASQLFN